jgi:CHAT domain-containing protein
MVPDIYDMTLNADVVVLSGCQTALGKHVRGEGPIGLARAFMYAGVPRVVASLWQVDDLATAELMKRFYRGMLVDELTPAASLRAAQRDLATGGRWASPYFWAPFVLQGDWH